MNPTSAETETNTSTFKSYQVAVPPVAWMLNQTLHDMCDLRRTVIGSTERLSSNTNDDSLQTQQTVVGLVLLHASWNKRNAEGYPLEEQVLTNLIREATKGLPDCQTFAGCVQVDETDDSLALCLGDDDSDEHHHFQLPCPPEEFPALAIVAQTLDSKEHAVWSYVPKLRSRDLVCALHNPLFDTATISNAVNMTAEGLDLSKIGTGILSAESKIGLDIGSDSDSGSNSALRIFVAGDRSSVGKSSVCLGILGSLLNSGYSASELAYIKPATQSESTQLIEVYCKSVGITCVPIGPLVYYRGFTRAFLAGETATTEQLLTDCGHAVDEAAQGKRVVLVDGVGFPAVGSICGTDNASVSRACGYPVIAGVDGNRSSSSSLISSNSSHGNERKPMGVVLVGGSGVGGAVDAFNLNATYFEMKHVPVLGAIFNKLSTEEGFYSLENCKQQVTAYFDQDAHHQALSRRPFGFVPLLPEIAGPNGMDHVQEFFRIFGSHVDVKAIVEAATRVKESVDPMIASTKHDHSPVKPRRMVSAHAPLSTRNRTEIEAAAIDAGAAPSA
jgi:dethiobiotin synthetase